MADEALNSFTSILGILPGVLDELEEILRSSERKQKEELARHQPIGEPERHRRKVSRTSSVHSHHHPQHEQPIKQDLDPNNLQPLPTDPVSSVPLRIGQDEPTVVKEQIPHMTESDALRLAQRKRKTFSNSSGRHSTPSKYRSRHMVVVYYDGDTQNRFESVVKTIGVCRNSMRKGKMSAKIDSLSRGGSSCSDDSNEEGLMNIAKIRSYSPRFRTSGFMSKNDGGEGFDEADGFLEQAQAMCEKAAHQVLRDGDCAEEVRQAKEQIAKAQKVGEDQLPELKRRADKAAERRRKEEEEAEARKRAEADKQDRDERAPDDQSQNSHSGSSPGNEKLEVDDADDVPIDVSSDEGDAGDEIIHALHLNKIQWRSPATLARYMQTS